MYSPTLELMAIGEDWGGLKAIGEVCAMSANGLDTLLDMMGAFEPDFRKELRFTAPRTQPFCFVKWFPREVERQRRAGNTGRIRFENAILVLDDQPVPEQFQLNPEIPDVVVAKALHPARTVFARRRPLSRTYVLK